MKKYMSKFILSLLIITIILSGCTPSETAKPNILETVENNKVDQENLVAQENQNAIIKEKEEIQDNTETYGNLEVHFIDVGQGDSIFIKQGNQTMLIDAGDNKYGTTVVNYLKSQKVEKLDYVIGTHPHADHIGGLDDVINSFKVDTVIMPNKMHTTRTFEDVLDAIANQGLKITTPVVGNVYQVGQANFTIVAPNKEDYNNLNNYSVAIRLEFGNQSFFFSGDAEKQAEEEIVKNGQKLNSTVMKAGHHGSNTSNSDILLDKVNPDFIVIQVGEGNKYDHPNQDILQKFEKRGITVYRNDLHGNIIITTDGETLDFKTDKENKSVTAIPIVDNNKTEETSEKLVEEVKPTEQTSELVFIGTKSTKKFHKTDCRHLPKPENQVHFSNLEEALNNGFEACKVCKPGQ